LIGITIDRRFFHPDIHADEVTIYVMEFHDMSKDGIWSKSFILKKNETMITDYQSLHFQTWQEFKWFIESGSKYFTFAKGRAEDFTAEELCSLVLEFVKGKNVY